MNNSDPTDAQVVAVPWADLFEAMTGFSDTTFLQNIQEDLVVSAPEHLSSAGSELLNFNTVSDTAFTHAPTPSMGAFTNLTSQPYPVSHSLIVDIDLPCRRHRISPMPGPCRARVRPILGFPTILRVHQVLKFS
jgi:hypothetical protein